MSRNSETIPGIPTTVLKVSGLIQGIGFRPFIFRIAYQNKLHGIVFNMNDGVVIHLQGENLQIDNFREQLFTLKPAPAIIKQVEVSNILLPVYPNFQIEESQNSGISVTQVSPDIAVCNDCLNDMQHQQQRIDYPFINCTHCGPRFSIIESLPYDRPSTSMKDFSMCNFCSEEYTNVGNRRFHAQPIACNDCGPVYCMHTANKKEYNLGEIFSTICHELENNGIVAMKGIGGYHLACNPFSEIALNRLHEIKQRDGKPFAVMVVDIDSAREIARLSKFDEEIIQSWERPILLVNEKYKGNFPERINTGLKTLGIFLPYMPFHHLFFRYSKLKYLVMTSANLSNSPLIIKDDQALSCFINKQVPVLSHNREIINRVDDSVVATTNGKLQILRRSRGFVPNPVNLNFPVDGIFASGAELSSTFCLGKGKQAILSQHIGDLKNAETLDFYIEAYERFKKLFRFEPRLAACDLHPDYLSTNFAQKLGVRLIGVQHHHAHIAACMAEYGLDEKVIGISYDGTGFGTDNNSWGGEIMLADLKIFERKYQFEYVAIPGGDKASFEPWRSAIAYLHSAFDGNIPVNQPFLRNIPDVQLKMTLSAIEKNINAPLSSGAGRLFDAVAAILNICTYARYHAEAPALLENCIEHESSGFYNILLEPIISWRPVIRQIIDDLQNRKISVSEISGRFHNTVAYITTKAALELSHKTGIEKIVLSGGVFQNRYLTKKIVDLITNTGMQVFIPSQIPCNDGGISLGQLVIASKQL